MKLLSLVCPLFLMMCQLSSAGPDFPLEDDLPRAETVMTARVVKVTEHQTTLRCMELLRGREPAQGALTLNRTYPDVSIGSEYLLVSQGDARCGLPKPRLGPVMRGQAGWSGWLPWQIKRNDDETIVMDVLTFVKASWFQNDLTHGTSEHDLTLPSVKQLLDHYPYDPHFNEEPAVYNALYRARGFSALAGGVFEAQSALWGFDQVKPIEGLQPLSGDRELDSTEKESLIRTFEKRRQLIHLLVFYMASSPKARQLERQAELLELKLTLFKNHRDKRGETTHEFDGQVDQLLEQMKSLPQMPSIQAQKVYDALIDDNYRITYD